MVITVTISLYFRTTSSAKCASAAGSRPPELIQSTKDIKRHHPAPASRESSRRAGNPPPLGRTTSRVRHGRGSEQLAITGMVDSWQSLAGGCKATPRDGKTGGALDGG